MADSEREIDRAVEALERGGLVIFPTETVYGIAAAAEHVDAVKEIFRLKQRPPAQAMTVHLGADADPDDWAVDVPVGARRLMDDFWPGPLTVVLKSRPEIPDVVRGGGDTIGLRVPDHPLALELFERFGRGVVATSANLHSRPSPATAQQARAALGDHVDVVLDGGPCALGLDSTVVDLSIEPPVLLRAGALGVDDIERLLGARVDRASGSASLEGTGRAGQGRAEER